MTFKEKIQELKEYMSDKNMFDYCDYSNGGRDDFDQKACELFGEDFTYFRWDPDNDTFDIAEAFQDVINTIIDFGPDGKEITDVSATYYGKKLDLAVIITYKNKGE